tara:strand:+ start:363 stop:533 length:171 start_codon:yes stop_codon:yes gene_type:complete
VCRGGVKLTYSTGKNSYQYLSAQKLMIKMHTSKVDKYGSLFGIGNPRKIHTRATCR